MVAITPTPKIKNLDKLLMHCQRRRHPAKHNIICAGERSESLFFIIKGSVTILIEDDDGREMIIAYLNTGDFFGELGLFEQAGKEQQRSAWVRAKVECEVAEISYTKFRELAQQDPDILYALSGQIAQRLRATPRKVGDLAFFDNADGAIVHVGLLLDDQQILHASGEVRIDPLDHNGIYHRPRQKYSHKLRLIKRILAD